MNTIQKDVELYKKNKESIDKCKPQIKNLFGNSTFDENLICYESDSGKAAYKYKTNDMEICLTGLHNPSTAAKDIIVSQYENNKEQIEKYTFGTVFALDPYLLEHFFQKFYWYKHVFVIFPSADFFYTLLHYHDFTELFKLDAFKPLAFNDDDKLDMNLFINLVSVNFTSNGLKIFVYYPFNIVAKPLLDRVLKSIPEAALSEQTNLSTSMLLGDMLFVNDLRSLDKFIKYPDISILKDKLQGKPVVCVAAGPSLGKNIEFLKTIQNEVYIIAVAAVLKPLLKHGIKPDLITILDMSSEIEIYLKDIDLTELTIAIEMSCYYGIMQNMGSNYILATSSSNIKSYLNFFLETLGINIPEDTKIGGSMTVAFMSIQLAARMGASEIILLGQDLAFEGLTHVEGASYSGGVKIIQYNGQDHFLFEKFGQDSNIIHPLEWIKGYNKEKVPTTKQFFVYLQYLERLIKARKFTVINSTEGGAYIEGAQHIPLTETYEKFIKNNRLETKDINLPKIRDYDFEHLKERVEKFEEIVTRYQLIHNLASEGLDDIEKFNVLTALEKPDASQQRDIISLMNSINNRIDILMNTYTKEINYVGENNPASYYLYRYLSNVNTKDYSEKDIMVDMKNKAILLFSAIKEGMEVFVRELTDVIKRIKEQYSGYL
ncbi:MAG: DUF115 domain-containing protein [Candidatus Margulisbacteria bacterium]|nr:DUF115 domain-containing protein [Candidatus Margulisiibacteriota bacterium]